MPKVNTYTCEKCHKHIVTVHRDEGTTPMFLKCRATEGCDGRMVSAMYVLPASFEEIPTHEWYAPGKKERRRLDRATRDQRDRGGLLLREIV